MARLNTRPSTVVASLRYGSPSNSDASNEENHEPNAARQRDKGKARAMDPPDTRRSLPTPNSDAGQSQSTARGQKRKRNARLGATQEEDVDEESAESDEEAFNRYFDPNQDTDKRRQVKRKSRALERNFIENRDDLLRGGGKALTDTIQRADQVFRNIKQTNDATLDSRLLVNISDLAYKKTAQLVLGDSSTGIDVDLFVSKCITFMRNGGAVSGGVPSRSQRPRRSADDSEAQEDDEDEMDSGPLDWEVFGRHACFPYNSRPAVPTFLLGPLSIEKKHRSQTVRRAKQTKDTNTREQNPQALTRAELSQSDENGLTTICRRIHKHLNSLIERASAAAERAGLVDLTSSRAKALMKKYRITDTGCPSLFEYVLNPHSFGQTVENLFYISFLIKEGHVGVGNDTNGLPSLMPTRASTLDPSETRRKETKKHQAVLALDFKTWKQLVKAFEVTEPMIPHREDEPAPQIGSTGWYT